MDWLDGPLWHLGHPIEEAIDLVTIDTPDGRAALLFTSAEAAQRHLASLPDTIETIATPADDLRAKEELLRAALASGAAILWIDKGEDAATQAERELTAKALALVLSYKREAACL